MKRIFSFIFSFSIYVYCYSQKAPATYGDIDRADLEMKVYEADSTAPAVVLCDYGYFNAARFQFTRLLRIKILKKEGYAWADKSFSFRFEKPGVRGTTYNLENGVVIESKLKSESVFTETVKAHEFYRTRIAMPDVKEGSVIDIELFYTGLPYEWRFQDVIPVRWSELIIEPTPIIVFHNTFFGTLPLQLQTDRRWVGINMPAFKEEPYMSCINNYITRAEIEISEINVPNRKFHLPNFYKNFSSSWESVNSILLRFDAYSNGLGVTSFLNDLAEEIKHSVKSREEMLKYAFESVKRIKWNEECDIYISHQTLYESFKKGTGNVADINLTLFQLLKKLDFETRPVVLRTRNSGVLSADIPSLDKLNYVIVQVEIDEKKYFLDATEEFLPYGLLPYRCMNRDGRTVRRPSGEWVNLRSSKKDKEVVSCELDLNEENLSLNGKMVYKRSDYAAFNFRKNYKTFNSKEEYLDDFKKDKFGLKILTSEILKLDSIYSPVQDQYEVRIHNQVAEVEGELYINPLLYGQLKENQFRSDERNYPVDFPYLIEKSFSGTIKIPQTYTVVSLPEAVKMQLPDNAASLIYQVAFVNNTIQYSCKLNINKEIFLPEEYADLKEFYSQVIKKQAESVILKKNNKR